MMAFGKAKKGKDKARPKGAADGGDKTAPATGGQGTGKATNLLLADLILRGAPIVLRKGVERGLFGGKHLSGKAMRAVTGKTLGESLLHKAALRIATRSVPGAIVVGGSLLAKTLYDRRKAGKPGTGTPARGAGDENGGEEA
jgi:hypothetical protein